MRGGELPERGGARRGDGPELAVVADRAALLSAARAWDGAVVVLAERARLGWWARRAPAARILTAPVSPQSLIAALESSGSSALVLVDGADAIGGWAFLERAEARLARLREELGGARVARMLVRDAPSAERLAELPEGADPVVDRLRSIWNLAGPSRRIARRTRAIWRVFALLAVLAAVVPLVGALFVSPSTDAPLVVGDPGGRVAGSLWLDEWVTQALAEQNWLALIETDVLWWPHGANLAGIFGSIGPALLAAPFVALYGYPGFWNPFVACALVLNGLAAAAFVRAAGAGRGPSILAGVGFAVSPPLLLAVEEGRQAQFLAFVLPLTLRAGLRTLDGHRHRDAVASLYLLVGAALVWWVYGAIAATILGVGLVHRLARDASSRTSLVLNLRRATHLVFPAAGLALLPGFVGFLHGRAASTVKAGSSILETTDAGTYARLEEVAKGSLALEQLWLGGGPLPGTAAHVALLVAAAFGILGLPRGRRPAPLVLAAVFAALAVGPWFDLQGVAYVAVWDALYRWLPLFVRSGVPGWLLVSAALWLALWLALCVGDLPGSPRLRRVAGFVAFALLAFGLPISADRAPLARFKFSAPPWWDYLAEPGGTVIVPFAGDDLPLAWQPLHGHPLALGPSPALALRAEGPISIAIAEDRVLRFLTQPGEPFFTRAALQGSWDAGMRWIVVDLRRLESVLRISGGSSQWSNFIGQIEQTFGPPRYASREVRAYALRDVIERQGLLDETRTQLSATLPP